MEEDHVAALAAEMQPSISHCIAWIAASNFIEILLVHHICLCEIEVSACTILLTVSKLACSEQVCMPDILAPIRIVCSGVTLVSSLCEVCCVGDAQTCDKICR